MAEGKKREVDAVTGIETTGHEWDGIKELNKPLPRWWVWTFYATIVWSIGYWIVHPAWPTLTSYTKGIWAYSQRSAVAHQIEQARAGQASFREKIAQSALPDIRKSEDLLKFALAAGGSSFQTNCAPCHGRNAQGFAGYPNLNDDDWLWGGSIEDIHKTILYGIRSGHKDARFNLMPRYGVEKLLTDAEIDAAAEYILSLSRQANDAAAVERGAKVFKDQCADCHGSDAKGLKDRGSPNLTDEIWLYGGTKTAIVESIRTGRNGQMPWWVDRLDPVTIKSLAVYVHSLGGGK